MTGNFHKRQLFVKFSVVFPWLYYSPKINISAMNRKFTSLLSSRGCDYFSHFVASPNKRHLNIHKCKHIVRLSNIQTVHMHI